MTEPASSLSSDPMTARPLGTAPSPRGGRDELAPLRICYVVSHFHPNASGAERQALAQGEELIRRGHRVHVLTREVPGSPRDEIISGTEVHRWIRPWPIGPAFGVSFVLSAVRALRQLRPEYDLIHTHQALWEAIAVGWGKRWLRGAPTLIQPASSGYYGEAEELMRTRGAPILNRWILRNTWFAAISRDIADQWLKLGVDPQRLSLMASGVDSTWFRPGPSEVESELPPRPRAIFTGRLHPQKNLEVLIDAWPSVLERMPASLVLLGHGPKREALEDRARRLGIAAHVRFVGAVRDPSPYLRGADVFVLPSVAEGMSNSLLEAMAAALPCLASNIGGNSDLIREGENGRLLPPDHPTAWAEALLELFLDPERRRRFGQASRARIDNEFALPVVVDRYIALYRRLLLAGG